MPKQKSRSFRATLEHLDSALGWVIARVPFDVRETWGSARVKVRGEVNGASFRTTLFPQRDGTHFLLVNKKLQKSARILPGSSAEFYLEPDTAPRTISIPAELEGIFKQSRRLKSWFENLSYSYQKWISDWVSEPKGTDSRRRRAEQIAERMLETMEAERELPPLIQTAFANNRLAQRGWQTMTPRQRRGELMAIFYYRTPDARTRRLHKTLQIAAAVAQRSMGASGPE
jgi:hypothetical protein